MTRAPTRRPPRAAGFTLVEVMVALLILAVLSAMAFRGIDAIMRAKDRAFAETDRTLKFNNGMSQFDYDVSQIVDTQVVDPLAFDGATLRLTRRSPQGTQLVLWTLQAGRWRRWASAPMTRVSQVQDAWLRSQQWDAISSGAVTVLDRVDAFQVLTYCQSGGWGNVQSSCGSQAPAQPGGTTQNQLAVGGGGGGRANTGTGAFPTGIQVQLKLAEGTLTRERELPTL